MARSISVKVPTSLLIEQIEERIAEIDKAIEEYPAKRKQFEIDEEAYREKVANYVIHYLEANKNRIGFDYGSAVRIITNFRCRVEVEFDTSAIPDFPERPKAPEQPNSHEHFGREYTTRKSLLEKNLTILKMTSQAEVNASTYGAIMEIL